MTILGEGRYELEGLLGRGGMADVHGAQDVRLGRTVAIKRLRVDLAGDPTFQARFAREAQSAASLNHPSIVSVYDTGEEPDPSGSGVLLPYIVMELVEGMTLRDILREGRKILPERALEITADVLSALDYSHRAGIIHRDIKPANVMLTPAGEVKVMDFGIARAIADSSATMTATAAVVGTAQYLSPEQARGEQVDARSDLYSTGCLLFELLTGRPPFVGDSPVSVAYQHVREQPSPPSTFEPSVSPDVDAITLKALAKRVDERYQSASEMRADIERALGGNPVHAPAVAGAAALETQPFLPPPAAVDPTATAVTSQGSSTYDEESSPRSRAGLWVLLALVGALIVIAALVLVPRLLSSGSATLVDVPNVVGKPLPAATTILERNGLQAGTPTPVFSAKPKGQVVAQAPQFPAQVDEGSTVQLKVSAGQETHTVPDLTPYFLKEAEAILVKQGFQPRAVKVADSTLRFGKVIRSDPPARSPEPVGTVVRVYYSAGYIRVPNVIGQSQAAATATLKKAHFTVIPARSTSDAPAGTVTRTDPPPETSKPYGSTVVIFVSDGPAPTTTPTNPTTPTAPTTPTSPTPTSPTTTSPTTTSPTTTTPTTTTPTTTTPTTTSPTTTTPTTAKSQ